MNACSDSHAWGRVIRSFASAVLFVSRLCSEFYEKERRMQGAHSRVSGSKFFFFAGIYVGDFSLLSPYVRMRFYVHKVVFPCSPEFSRIVIGFNK